MELLLIDTGGVECVAGGVLGFWFWGSKVYDILLDIYVEILRL